MVKKATLPKKGLKKIIKPKQDKDEEAIKREVEELVKAIDSGNPRNLKEALQNTSFLTKKLVKNRRSSFSILGRLDPLKLKKLKEMLQEEEKSAKARREKEEELFAAEWYAQAVAAEKKKQAKIEAEFIEYIEKLKEQAVNDNGVIDMNTPEGALLGALEALGISKPRHKTPAELKKEEFKALQAKMMAELQKIKALKEEKEKNGGKLTPEQEEALKESESSVKNNAARLIKLAKESKSLGDKETSRMVKVIEELPKESPAYPAAQAAGGSNTIKKQNEERQTEIDSGVKEVVNACQEAGIPIKGLGIGNTTSTEELKIGLESFKGGNAALDQNSEASMPRQSSENQIKTQRKENRI